ncbi:hypothetical protein lerEdw1_011187 [Lerista edwardsae]|nr:hypothetical protein lerEdw1_011187 [Lerista edwardsae]
MKLLPKILAHSIEHNQHIEESRQLLSYALIHPATSLEDRSALAMWLNHLEDRTSGTFGGQSRGRSDSVDYGQSHYYHQRQNSDDKLNGWQSSRDSGICLNASSWQEKNLGCENGHLPLYSSSSVPTTINTIGTSAGTIGYFGQLSSSKKIQNKKHWSALLPGHRLHWSYMKELSPSERWHAPLHSPLWKQMPLGQPWNAWWRDDCEQILKISLKEGSWHGQADRGTVKVCGCELGTLLACDL